MDLGLCLFWLRRLLLDLDMRVFEEARGHASATLAGIAVAGVSLLLSGLGGWLWWLVSGFGDAGDIFLHSTVIGSLIALALWALWLGVVYLILTQLFRQRAYVEQLMRVMGLAMAPLALTALMFIPLISFAIGVTALAATFALSCVAIKSVTSAENGQVLAANAAGFLVWASVLTLLASSSTLQPHAPGVFLFQTTATVTDEVLELQ